MKIIQSILEAFSAKASEETKEYLGTETMEKGAQLITDVTVDSITGLIPYIGPQILNFKARQAITNQKIFMEEIKKRLNILEKAVEEGGEEYQQKIDNIFLIGSDATNRCMQEDKIKYIANGVLNSIDNDYSFDMSILYFSILDKITILEIEILNNLKIPYYERKENYKSEIIKKFNITEEGYTAAKYNLIKVGLLESRTENYIQHDIDNILKSLLDAQKDINEISNFLKNKSKKLKVSGNKKVNSKTKNTIKISKLGSDFINHFIK
ncbi:Uncharacterised protein [Staphylococcus piscifermentans]|uniref:Uncharacterized protein n=1 Tax=Staphylococcus piscifermentans TaxID=70258 RepID=A0A239TH26_9STAP|nr:hypothetical protein [Staphylococcus piscifermentans]RTX83654.1 hypothetical protein CD139_08370 [Staphylococcus piscifermentans]GEP85345.1 hypothetical protein SPI02_19300 [Staphylococcus piscifermentans]SNU96977.1 Uncharacterised protein [Staphylococcus piscifermentans]